MTSKVLTEKFKSQNALDFYNNLNVETYHVMASCVTDISGDVVNSVAAKNEFLRRVIFGNSITKDDARFLFRKISWVDGKIYTEYDDVVDLTNKDYYVTILIGDIDEASYRVYKCINNNAGSASTVSPSTVSFGEMDDGYFGTSDGYIWKYMFDITPSEYTKYQTVSALPYRPLSSYNANDGIYNMKISESSDLALTLFSEHNLGACQILSTSQDADGNFANRVQVINQLINIKTEENAYVGMTLEVNGELYDIIGSSKPSNLTGNILIIKTNEAPPIQKCFVKPKITITNSNNGGIKCQASGILDEFGRLVRVHFNEHGSGYTYANAKLELPRALSQFRDIVSLRPIVSPAGGHGADPVIELKMSSIGIVTNIVADSNTNTPGTNTYTQVGLVKNASFTTDESTPLFFDNRNKLIVLGDVTNSIEPNKYIVQENDETVYGYIHEVNYDADLNITDVWIVDYVGPAQTQLTSGIAQIKNAPNATDGISFEINNIEQGGYVDKTGDLLHFVSFDPITRTTENVEKIKFVFDF
mgnify:CR=1 FL=1